MQKGVSSTDERVGHLSERLIGGSFAKISWPTDCVCSAVKSLAIGLEEVLVHFILVTKIVVRNDSYLL